MKRALRLLIRLYPAHWRARYGGEFEALLEDMNPRHADLFNVALGALQMQIGSQQSARTIAIFGIAGTILAGAIGMIIPGRYLATSVGRAHGGSALPAVQELLSRTALSRIVQDFNLYPKERQRKPLDDVVEAMRTRDIRIRRGPGDAVNISFAYADPVLAQRTAEQLIRRVALLNDEAHRPAFEVLDTPGQPAPIVPNRLLEAAIGCVAGLLLGTAFTVFRRKPRSATRATVIALSGAIAGFFTSFAVPARYTSTAVVLTPPSANFERRVADPGALADIVLKENLYPQERAKGTIQQAVALMQKRDLNVVRAGTAVTISFTYPDRFKAQRVAYDMGNGELMQSARPENKADIVDAASLPELPVSPNRSVCAMLGVGAGLLLLPLRRKRDRPA